MHKAMGQPGLWDHNDSVCSSGQRDQAWADSTVAYRAHAPGCTPPNIPKGQAAKPIQYEIKLLHQHIL